MVQRAITEEILRRRLSVNVRSLRQAALLTLKKSSERAEMHWRHWQKIEAGQVNITLQTLVRLADVLDADPADLLREPPQRDAKPAETAPPRALTQQSNGVSGNVTACAGAPSDALPTEAARSDEMPDDREKNDDAPTSGVSEGDAVPDDMKGNSRRSA